MARLSSLPSELLLHIASFIPSEAAVPAGQPHNPLSALSRVSHRFYTVLTPVVYHTVHLTNFASVVALQRTLAANPHRLAPLLTDFDYVDGQPYETFRAWSAKQAMSGVAKVMVPKFLPNIRRFAFVGPGQPPSAWVEQWKTHGGGKTEIGVVWKDHVVEFEIGPVNARWQSMPSGVGWSLRAGIESDDA